MKTVKNVMLCCSCALALLMHAQNKSDNVGTLKIKNKTEKKGLWQSKEVQKNYCLAIADSITNVKDTTILWFIKHNNYVKYYPCYLSPFSDYCQKNEKQITKHLAPYCFTAQTVLKYYLEKEKILSKTEGCTHTFANKRSAGLIFERCTCFIKDIEPPLPLSKNSILPLYALGYEYDYTAISNTLQDNNNAICPGNHHECLIVDVLHQQGGMMYILTFNYPEAYYAVMLYDTLHQVLIPNIDLVYNMKNTIKEDKTMYVDYVFNLLFTDARRCYVFKVCKMWDLFVWYDKKKIKKIYYKQSNKNNFVKK